MIREKFNMSAEDAKMCGKIAYRALSIQASMEYEKMQALAFIRAMIPAINRYYNKKEDRIEAYRRHWEIFNTNPNFAGFIAGLAAAMEKQASEDPDMDKTSINAVKASLMGPLAGIGDSIFWGSWRIVATGIGLSFAMQGNVIGPLLMLIIYNIPATICRYFGPFLGFSFGTRFLQQASKSGLMQFLTKAASIVGLMTVGAMTSSMVTLTTTYVFVSNDMEMSLQSLIDSILPSALPLLMVLGCFHFLNKGVKANVIIIGMILLSILGRLAGIV